MRASLYLLALTFSFFFKYGYCGKFEDFKSNEEAMDLVAKYHNYQIKTQKDLNDKLKEIDINITGRTLNKYLNKIKKAGGGSRNYISFEQFKDNSEVMSLVAQYYDQNNKDMSSQKKLLKKLEESEIRISETALNEYLKMIKEAGGGSRYISFEQFINNSDAMALVKQYNNKQIKTQQILLDNLKHIGVPMGINRLARYIKYIAEAGIGAPNLQTPQIAGQSSNFTSGNPGSSTSASKKGKSTNSGGGSRKITFDQFKNNHEAMSLVKQFDNKQITDKALLKALKQIKLKMNIKSMYLYLNMLNEEKKAGGGTPNFEASASASGNPGSSIPNKASVIQEFSKVFGVESNPYDETLNSIFQSPPINAKKAIEEEANKFLAGARQKLYERQYEVVMQSVPGHPGSLTSASNRGKSTNFSKAPGASSHYGGAMPSQQVPPMDDTFVPLPSQTGTDSTDWFGGNSQNDDGDLQSMVNPPSSWKRALGFVSNLFGASPQEPQFSPSMHVTPAASSYYPSNQPDDGSLQSMITPRNQKDASSYYGGAMPSQQVPPTDGTFMPSQAGTDSTKWFVENSQNNDGDLASVVKPKNTSSWKGFYGTPFSPNQSQSTGRTGASNFNTGNPGSSTSKGKSTNFSKAPGSSSHYGGTMPFQQAPPMSGTLFPAFSNQPSNQSAPFNPSTNSVSSQPGTPSLDWSEGNSQNDDGDLYSMIRPKRPSSSKDKSATKTGKKPRK